MAPQIFIETFALVADWTEDPGAFGYNQQVDEIEHANQAGFYSGRDAMTGAAADLQISLNVSGRGFLGYAFYSITEKMNDRAWVNHLMMQLGASKLTDFAVK